MHFSRMRTARFSGRLYWKGGMSASGSGSVCLWVQWGVSSSGLRGCIPHTPSPPFTTPPFTILTVDRQTPVRTLPCPKPRLRAVINCDGEKLKSSDMLQCDCFHSRRNEGQRHSVDCLKKISVKL